MLNVDGNHASFRGLDFEEHFRCIRVVLEGEYMQRFEKDLNVLNKFLGSLIQTHKLTRLSYSPVTSFVSFEIRDVFVTLSLYNNENSIIKVGSKGETFKSNNHLELKKHLLFLLT